MSLFLPFYFTKEYLCAPWAICADDLIERKT